MDILLALALAVALAVFGVLCISRTLFPCSGMKILIHTSGDGDELQQKLYALVWLRGLGLLSCPIFLEDDGLSPQGKLLVEHLCNRWPEVALWQEE